MASVAEHLDKLHGRLRGALPGFLKRLLAHLDKEAEDPWKVLRLTIRLSALGVAAPLALSHDLWFQDNRLYLPSPIVPALSLLPHALNGVLYYGMLACCAAIFFFPQWRRLGFLLPPVFVLLVLQDQLRGQFYLEMSVFNLLVAAAVPREVTDRHLDPLRYMTIGVYFWAGFYKLNANFIEYMFPWFVSHWFPYTPIARYVGFFVPFIEAATGLSLLFPPTRWIGRCLAFSMLTVVLISLGPYGHNQALNVWPANVYIDSLAVFLFAGARGPLLEPARLKKPLCRAALLLFVFVPLLGMPNILGPHPTFKLFCVCGETGQLEFGPRERLDFLPDEIGLAPMKDHRLTATQAAYPLGVSGGNFMSGSVPFIDGFRGFCPHLSYPREARLHVLSAVHFWSTDAEEAVYAICTPEPQAPQHEKAQK